MKDYNKLTEWGIKILYGILILWFAWILLSFISKTREKGIETCVSNGYAREYCESLDR